MSYFIISSSQIYDKNNNYSVKFLQLDGNDKGEIDIKNFGTNYKSLVIVPSLQTKLSGFDGSDFIYPYSFTVSITGDGSDTGQTLIQKLLAQKSSESLCISNANATKL